MEAPILLPQPVPATGSSIRSMTPVKGYSLGRQG